jgi:hypothetical protein
MGGVGQKITQGATWLGQQVAGVFGAYGGSVGLPPRPPAPPSYTDRVVQLARERERRRQAGGGRSSTFLSGVLGDQSVVSPTVKKMIGS